MTFPTSIVRGALLSAAAMAALAAGNANAQCATCPTPTLATPTVAYSPVVYQSTTQSEGWYPFKYMARFGSRLFGGSTTTTYSAGYAPATYSAGYAPATYSAGYAPSYAYTAAYTPTYPPTYTAGYAPSYSASYAPTSYATASYAPTSYPTSYAPSYSSNYASGNYATSNYASSSPCTNCSPVSTAYYESSASGCSGCGESVAYGASPANYQSGEPTPAGGMERPSIPADEDVPTESSVMKPETENAAGQSGADANDGSTNESPADGGAFIPPALLGPGNQLEVRRPTAPVWTAVYQKPVSGSAATPVSQSSEPQLKHRPSNVSASSWVSAAE